MKNLVRVLVSLLVALATLFLVNCGGAPGCTQVTFGSSSTCSGSSSGGTGFGSGGTGGGGGGGGGGSSTPSSFAYIVDQNGTMDGYAFSAQASTIGPISNYTAPTIPTNSGGIGTVVAQGKFLYAVIEDTQQIFGWQIGASGTLTALADFPVTVSGLTGVTAVSYNQQVVITNPAGTLLFIDQPVPEQIFVYQISSAGALTLAPGAPFSTVAQSLEPQNMAMDGQGRYLYVSEFSDDHSGTAVVGYSVSSAGVLTAIPNYATWGNIPIWQMQGEPTGQYMLGITGETNYFYGSDDLHIHVYSINQTSGVLTEAAGSPWGTTYAPFNIAVQPELGTSGSSESVYSFSVNDDFTSANAIEAYQLDPTTGALSVVPGSPFGNLTASVWGQFDPSGQYLFLYIGAAPDIFLGELNIGSGGVLTETTGTTQVTTEGYWAVSDIP
jgi:6-phosphogluconolactonase (cycloisomerase 2 family)